MVVAAMRTAAAASAVLNHADDIVLIHFGDVEIVFAAETVLHKSELRIGGVFCAFFGLVRDDLVHPLFFGAAAEFFNNDVVFHNWVPFFVLSQNAFVVPNTANASCSAVCTLLFARGEKSDPEYPEQGIEHQQRGDDARYRRRNDAVDSTCSAFWRNSKGRR
jgi:hypothetical protein